MPTIDELDAITLESLRTSGATRWNKPNGAIGAFTAEMDYGIAPAITDALHGFVDTGLFGYLPPSLRTDMQQAQAGFLSRRLDWDVPPEWIHEVPDVLKALEMAMEHYARWLEDDHRADPGLHAVRLPPADVRLRGHRGPDAP